MFKLTLKIFFTSFLLLGAAFIFCLPSVAADAAICSSAPLNPPSGNWGVHSGGGQGDLSGLEVNTAVYGQGNVNVNYRVYSYDNTATSTNYTNGTHNKQGIWKWAGDQTGRADLTYHTRQFSTGEGISNGTSTYSCDGWSVFGHGTSDSAGNGYVLNCGDEAGEPYKYIITNLPNTVNGTSGKWQEILYDSSHPSGQTITNDVNGNPTLAEVATNGGTNLVKLIFHPDTNPEPSTGTCKRIDVSNPDDDDKATRTGVWASGVPGIANPTYFPDDNGDKDSISTPHTFRPNANSIDVVTVSQWYKPDEPNKGWHNYKDAGDVIKYYLKSDGNFARVTYTNHTENSHPTITCFSATCSINYVDGNGPQNGYNPDGSPHYAVLAGGPMYIHGTFLNTSPAPTYLAMSAGAYLDGSNGTTYTLGFIPYSGISVGFMITATAPAAVQTYNITFTPQYNASETNMTSCSLSGAYGGNPIPVYQKFITDNQVQSATLSPTSENPTQADYYTQFRLKSNSSSVSIPQVHIPTISTYTVVGATKDSYTSSGPAGDYSAGTHKWTGNSPDTSITAGPDSAGDEYCASLYMEFTSGYIGPGGYDDIVNPSGGYNQTSCDHVTNEPYYKVRGSGAAASINLYRPGGACPATANEGLLAGWNDNTDDGTGTVQERGAGAQLSALALIKISGFASAQTNYTRSPTALTFANTNGADITSDRDAPSLGGNFDPGVPPRCITAPKPPSDVTPTDPGSSLNLPADNNTTVYEHTGNLTLTSDAAGIGGSKSIFVDGDVYIAENVKYKNTGWTVDSDGATDVPSFALVATGNIYIDPSVTELDGLYVARSNDSGDGGIIYTCGTSAFNACADSSLFNGAKNQLVVYGSFVADQVRLYRTIGSLRDEQPTGGSPAGSQLGLVWSCGGDGCNPSLSGLNCISMNVTLEPASDTWADNKLCAPPSSGVQLNWNLGPVPNTLSGAKAASGLPYCTLWDVNTIGEGAYWDNNWLCSNKDLTFSYNGSIGGKYCTQIVEPSDNDAGGLWHASGGKAYLCEPLAASATPPGPPAAPACSNKGSQLLTQTCAAEIFQFGPEFYLSEPALQLPNNGAPQFDSINSLPPVL